MISAAVIDLLTLEGRRPGKEPGLNWEEARAEKAEHEVKVAQKRAKAAERKASNMRQQRFEDEGCKELARLEDLRLQGDQAEDEYLGRSRVAASVGNCPSIESAG